MKFLTYLLIILIWILIVGWFTGSKDYIIGPNDDERKKAIKQKTVVQSWQALLLFLITNYFMNTFNINPEVKGLGPGSLELFYLIVSISTYIIFYIINIKKMSA